MYGKKSKKGMRGTKKCRFIFFLLLLNFLASGKVKKEFRDSFLKKI